MTIESQPRNQDTAPQWPKRVLLAEPRGFCAGVVRSVEAYRNFIKDNPGQTIFSVGEPAHNTHVNSEFLAKGVIFVNGNEISEVPKGGKGLLGPHGSTPEDLEIARNKHLTLIDTECPLVTKVHREARRYLAEGRTIFYFGKRGHVESRGILGEEDEYKRQNGKDTPGRILLFEAKEKLLQILEQEKDNLDPQKLAFLTQTTHAAKKSEEIMKILQQIYPDMAFPRKQDICYATQNRQDGVKAIIQGGAEVIVVVGSPHSSNSKELSNVAKEAGAKVVFFVDTFEELDKDVFKRFNIVGLTSGASVPEDIFQEVVGWFRINGSTEFIPVSVADESLIKFSPAKIQKL